MKKVNIEQEVMTAMNTRKSELSEFKVLAETQKLLEYNDTVDRNILRTLSPLCAEVYAEKETGKIMELENLQAQYGSKVIHITAIKALALKYRMRLLPSTSFKSSYTPEVISMIKEFAKKQNIELNQHNLSSKFYILAPATTFKLETGVKRQSAVQESPETKARREERARAAALRQIDPSIFYKVSDDEFVHLKTWGKDFTILRAIKGFFTKNHTNFFMSNAIIATLVVALGLIAFTSLLSSSILAFSIISIVAGVLISSVALVSYDGFLSNQVWNSVKKNEDRKIIVQY